jgi:N-acetylglutamate synthase-like GNAT family acetyltransferase
MILKIYISFNSKFYNISNLSNSMIFRNATPKDVDRCIHLAKQENEDYWNKSDFENSIQNDNAIFLVVEIDGIVAGYVTGFVVPTKNDEAMVHESRIDLNFRRKKLGTKLVNEFCKEAFRKGAKIVYAMIESELKPFYINSCNFKETGNWIETSIRLQDEK